MTSKRVLAAVALLHCANLASAAEVQPLQTPTTERPNNTVQLSPCTLPDVAQPARCGAVEVPENPARPNERRLTIGVAVVPAASGQALADPIAVLMGGPGEEAISSAAWFAQIFAPLLQDRDLLLVDQRGTGRSSALSCQLYSPEDPATNLRHLYAPNGVARCLEQLRTRADLTQYTFAHFAGDLEQVRRALGYGRLNLFSASYGTRAAQVYTRLYPGSVRTVYMGSVVPLDVPTTLTFTKTTQAVLTSLFDACAADVECNSAFPKLREEFDEILARLERGINVSVQGIKGTVPLHRGRVVEWFRSRLYRPADAAALPWLIHQAHSGDWSPIVAGILENAKGFDTALSVGVFFSITCGEDIAFIGEAAIGPATAGTFLGDYRVREQQAACAHWPKSSLPPDYRTPVRSATPVLFVSGDSDAATPLWFTEHVAPGWSNRLEVILEGRGHTEWNDCVGNLYDRFVRTGTTRGLEASCEPTPRPPFKIR